MALPDPPPGSAFALDHTHARTPTTLASTHRPRTAPPTAAESPSSKKELESLFVKELKRRGLDSIDDVPGWQPKDDEGVCVFHTQQPGNDGMSSRAARALNR
jgi:hypothetical protein